MAFSGFTDSDFDVFYIPGLEPRMEALIERVRPKLHELGDRLSPALSALCGEEMFPHVAKHARRTINPPNDTWVAWANNKKGYKAHPHFQVGLWPTHLFVQFALIYESPNKAAFGRQLERHWNDIQPLIPAHYVWSLDHMQPEATPHAEMKGDTLDQLIHKLQHVKKSEALCGLHIDRRDPLAADGERLIAEIEHVFETVMPLYRLAYQI
ncbi:YktB family protein [Paenibacillus validus]|uniref:UPF0637 protein GNP93_20855 n=1 Tax=Paenibacillus validus TaxID=44253 RepID=A0A7X2ZDZ3_9BACL|nr:DUF1054 domain-containing protein [Paenibacillus validus]MUG73084.1 DUF1054 family protein [Paenibacillus validus]